MIVLHLGLKKHIHFVKQKQSILVVRHCKDM